jgi:cyanophycinase
LVINVIGAGAVTIVDGSAMTFTNIGEAKGYEPLTVLGIHLDVLASGFKYNLNTRQPILGIHAAK